MPCVYGASGTSEDLCFVTQLADERVDAIDNLTSFALGGSFERQDGDLGGDVDAEVLWREAIDLLALGLDDAREARVARLVEAKVSGDDRGELDALGARATVDLATDRGPAVCDREVDVSRFTPARAA